MARAASMHFASRSLVTILAALSLVLGVAGTSLATEPTEPPTVGGTLSAEGKTIHVFSNGNVPAHVVLTSDLTDLTFSKDSFDIQPGQTVDLTFKTSRADGTVTALYTTDIPDAQEQGTAALSLRLTPGKVPPPPFDPTLPAVLLLTLAALLLILRKTRPWTYRVNLTRASSS